MQRFRRYTFLLSPDRRHRTSCVATGQSYELECVQQLINFAHNLHRHEIEWVRAGRGNFAHTGEDGRHEMSEVMVMISLHRQMDCNLCVLCICAGVLSLSDCQWENIICLLARGFLLYHIYDGVCQSVWSVRSAFELRAVTWTLDTCYIKLSGVQEKMHDNLEVNFFLEKVSQKHHELKAINAWLFGVLCREMYYITCKI